MNRQRRFLIPEVIQTSSMDCGPASLKAVLAGFGIEAAYDQLREACHTEVDGTSIDTIEAVAQHWGLEAEQMMMPVDHLLVSPESLLPALVVLQQPQGLPHFAVVWRKIGAYLLMMDPAKGRRWVHQDRFHEELYVHRAALPAATWRDWAGGPGFLDTMQRAMQQLGCREREIAAMTAVGTGDTSWFALGCLDAALRMAQLMFRGGAVKRGAEAERLVKQLFFSALNDGEMGRRTIPIHYWSVRQTINDETMLGMDGAVFVTFARAADAGQPTEPKTAHGQPEVIPKKTGEQQPWRQLTALLQRDSWGVVWLILVGLIIASAAVLLEALLFRGLLTLGGAANADERLATIAALLLFMATLLCLQMPVYDAVLRLGRRLEVRLRLAILQKIPWLGDRYFHSRASSDLAERAHRLVQIRDLPTLLGQCVALLGNLLVTAAAMIWLAPQAAPLILVIGLVAVLGPLLSFSSLAETDLKVRTYLGSMGKFYLDALMGLVPTKAHGSEGAIRAEHEGLLVAWAAASKRFLWQSVALDTLQLTLLTGLTIVLIVQTLLGDPRGGDLLLIYWALNLPLYGEQLAQIIRRYPAHRNVTLRLLEPLNAPGDAPPHQQATNPWPTTGPGPAVCFDGVALAIGGHPILHDLAFSVPAGGHVAIVGPSGAGKSSLVGLLQGRQQPAQGQLRIDGIPLTPDLFESLRAQTAWIDPAVWLWNRSLHENLCYGGDPNRQPLDLVKQADLLELLEKLPEGYHTEVGEGGGLLSGGEAQRVRLARAMTRPNARLVIMDEPFRGLDPSQRRALLARARGLWSHATLFCITHDLHMATEFQRVLVMEAGRVVEDGDPAILAATTDSRFAALMRAEQQLQTHHFAERASWRRWHLAQGRLAETPLEAPHWKN